MNTLSSYIKIVRPINCMLAGLSLYIGILITMGYDTLKANLYLFTIGAIIFIFVSAGGFVINDIYDLEIDKINQPQRILPSGKISLESAKIYTVVLFSISLLISFYALTVNTNNVNIGLLPPIFVIIGILCLILYAAVLKKLGVLGNLIITALSTIPFIIGGLFINDITRGIFPVLLVIGVQYSREIIKDVEDVKGDVEASDFMLSLPTIIGVRNTANLGKLFLFLTIFFTTLPFITNFFPFFRSWAVVAFGLVIDAIALYSIIILHGNEDNLMLQAKKVKKLLKLAIFIGLVGLALNPFTGF